MSPRRTVSSDSRSSGSSAERPAIAKTAKLRRALLELDPEERHRKLVGAGALGGEEGRGVLEGPSGLFVTSRLEERSSEIGADEAGRAGGPDHGGIESLVRGVAEPEPVTDLEEVEGGERLAKGVVRRADGAQETLLHSVGAAARACPRSPPDRRASGIRMTERRTREGRGSSDAYESPTQERTEAAIPRHDDMRSSERGVGFRLPEGHFHY